ncbi:MAG: coiled-coil domain-containing protein 22 [Sulfurihydrogenibium sp.]|nr:coiled-coil domain-containing protein 22 [Sulfurihydrogenibium sp.]
MLKTNFDETYEKNKKMAKKVFFAMLGIGIIAGTWQYENHKLDEEISKLKAEKLQLETENTELKKELEKCKELQAYVEKNKKAIELLRQIDYNMKGGN